MKLKHLFILVLSLFSIGTWATVKQATDTGENSKAFVPKLKSVEGVANVNAAKSVESFRFEINNVAILPDAIVTIEQENITLAGKNVTASTQKITLYKKVEIYRRARDGVPAMS